MNFLSSTLFWTLLQTTLLALLTLALGSRPWRIGGSSAPLFGLIGVALITILAFLPIPWSWNISTFVPSTSVTSLSPTIEKEMKNEGASSSVLEHGNAQQPLLQPEGTDLGTSFVTDLFAGLRDSKEPSGSRRSTSPLSLFVFSIFGIGTLIGTLRLVLGLIAAQRLTRSCSPIDDDRVNELLTKLRSQLGLESPVEVYQTSKLSTAATLGIWRSRILLPNHWKDWSEAELKAVLAHELAHIAHGDFAAALIAQLSLVVHFYHPLVHWLSGRLRLEQELAADSVAARIAGGERNYLKVLAKLALEHQDRFVGWPARPFLPTRHTFLRRLEMLRDGKSKSQGSQRIGRWFAIAAIGMASIVLVGLKPPANLAVAQDVSPKVDAKGQAAYDLRYFSDEGGIIVAAKPAEIIRNKGTAGIAEQFQNQPLVMRMISPLGVELKDIEQVIVCMDGISKPPSSTYVRASKPIAKLSSLPGGTATKLAGADVLVSPLGDSFVWKPDEQSLVFGSKRNVERMIQGRQLEHKLTESEIWKRLAERPLLVLGEGKVTRGLFRDLQWEKTPVAFALPMISPAIDEAEVLGFALALDRELNLTAMAKSTDAKGAAVIQETTQAVVRLLKNGMSELKIPIEQADSKKMLMELHAAGTKLLEGVKGKTEGTTVSVSTSIPIEDDLIASISGMLGVVKRGAERSQSANNLKLIALSFHNFHDAYRQFPNTTLSPNAEHKFPVSWRVMILPWIEQDALYREYRFDEPWDGPNNSKLLAKMPATYRHPDAPADSTVTSYVALSGDETIFRPKQKASIADILDGTSNTILIVESKTAIPWTKPEDLEYSSKKPLPILGGFSENGFQAAFADGSVRFLAKTLAEAQLRALITAKGGEVITQ